jgi:Peptidase A4 family
MFTRLRSLIATGALLAIGAWFAVPAAAVAAAPVAPTPEAASANWAGYVANATGSSQFSRVSGSWVQPSANTSAGDGYSAFWVGLGGAGQSQSQSLEQVGTQANVVGGQTVYYAWYELLPAAPVKLSMPIHPGDHISASVSVNGTNVTISLSDQTTGSSYNNTFQMSNPDTSSAEWIAEAPSTASGDGSLQPLPLADFGTVGFSNATATAGGHTGSISDSSWSDQAVQLSGSSTAAAQPSTLSSDGSSFSVSWQSANSPASVSTGGYGGYGDGGGYGYGGYGPGAYGGYGGYGPGTYGGYGAYGPAAYAYGF